MHTAVSETISQFVFAIKDILVILSQVAIDPQVSHYLNKVKSYLTGPCHHIFGSLTELSQQIICSLIGPFIPGSVKY